MLITVLLPVAHREMLGDLQESFNSLEEGSKGMVAQVRASFLQSGFFVMESLIVFTGKETGYSADCQRLVLVQVKYCQI